MKQYLYGVDVQGIQSYIFATDKLKEIAGASELVEQVCSQFFEACLGSAYQANQVMRKAGGSIRYVFTDREVCERLVRHFPRYVAERVPGLTSSQAVVPIDGNLKMASEALNRRLRQARLRPPTPSDLGWMIHERARRTGLPGVAYDRSDVIDEQQKSKLAAATDSQLLYKKLIGPHRHTDRHFAHDLSDLTPGDDRAYIAVVHADGNGLGQLIQTLLDKLNGEQQLRGYRTFSAKLQDATEAAVQWAFHHINDDEALVDPAVQRLWIRPVLIGGDDVTVIMRAGLALRFTALFLEAFERETTERFSHFAADNGVSEYFKNGLTACAGIAYVKENYPFHYAVDLAESLCTWTKVRAKKIDPDRAPSALHFHKVQSSFVGDYNEIVDTQLTTEKHTLTAGPYFLSTQADYLTIAELRDYVDYVCSPKAPAGPLRNWLGELQQNKEQAEQRRQRLVQVHSEAARKFGLDKEIPETLQLGDALAHLNL